MKVLLTGATGYVGSRVAAKLVARGDQVIGVARSPNRAKALPTGVQPLVADLSEVDRLAVAARGVDAVIHTGFTGHGGEWEASVALDARLINAFVDALESSGKTLIVSNGTVFLGGSGKERLTEATPVVEGHPAAIRAKATHQAREAAARGVRGIELRLASFVYGDGGSVFLPALVRAADKAGFAMHVGEGANRTSTAHVDAAADAYLAALDRGEAGGLYHIAGDEEPTMAEIAQAIGIGRAVPVRSVDMAEAAELTDPFTAYFLTVDNRIDSLKARTELGWTPAGHVPLLFDVAHGSYARQRNR
jgi:nucleoside-diphosphate-sugar epimerase